MKFNIFQGVPLPEQEQCAIDAVMQYAIHELGFMPDDIALFAWSIGGYSATWAAMNYPDVKFMVSQVLKTKFGGTVCLPVVHSGTNYILDFYRIVFDETW